jgi:hypothetical protein
MSSQRKFGTKWPCPRRDHCLATLPSSPNHHRHGTSILDGVKRLTQHCSDLLRRSSSDQRSPFLVQSIPRSPLTRRVVQTITIVKLASTPGQYTRTRPILISAATSTGLLPLSSFSLVRALPPPRSLSISAHDVSSTYLCSGRQSIDAATYQCRREQK